MNGSFTMLAFAMAGLGVTPPEHIPPAPAPAGAYQGLDCFQLMRAAEVADRDLARAWDRQETLLRHRFGAPPPIVRRSEANVAQLKGELEAIWRVADSKACGDAPEVSDLAWAPGRDPGPMLGEPRERAAPPPAEPEAPTYEADEAMGEAEAPPEPEPQSEPQDWAEAAPPEEPPEVDGYGEPDDRGPAAWPDRVAPAAEPRRAPNGDIDWPAPEARPSEPVDRSDLAPARRL